MNTVGLMERRRWRVILSLLVMSALAGCNFTNIDATPTVNAVVEEPINPLPAVTASASPTLSPTPQPTPTPAPAVILASATASPTPGLPTETPIPTETLGPFRATVAAGDTLFNIIQRPPFNYRNYDVVSEILRLNNLSSADSIFAGQELIIPRQTPTPIPTGVELTVTARAALGLDAEGRVIGAAAGCHEVQDGQSMVSIVEQYPGMTLEIARDLNPDISFFGCDFNIPSGGPECGPLISVGQCVNVLLPTATPTASPTPSGSETPTPTPTYTAPRLAYPPEGGTAPGGIVDLEWVSVGILEEDEMYLIEVTDVTTGAIWRDVTRNTEITLPESLIPTDGQTHEMLWRVSIAVRNEAGTFSPVGAPGRQRTFFWQSR